MAACLEATRDHSNYTCELNQLFRAQHSDNAAMQRIQVTVIGDVVRPGRYEFKGCATALDAAARASGFTQFRTKMVILRREGQTMKRIPYDDEPCLRDGDILVTP